MAKTERLFIRISSELKQRLESAAKMNHLELSAYVRQVLSREMEQQNMTQLINISDEYGDEVPVTLSEYQELNPDGTFEDRGDEIREIFSDTPGDWETIAVEQSVIDTQRTRDHLLLNDPRANVNPADR